MNKASRDKRAPAAPTQLPDTKTCRICQQSKPADQFYRGRVNQDGLYSYCKACATKIDTQRKKEYRQRKRAEAAAAAGAEGGGVAVGGVSVEARERLRAVTAGGSGLGSSLGGQYGTGAESIVDGIAGFDASGGYGGGYVHAAQAGAQYQDPQYQTYPGAEYDPEGVLQYDAPGGHGAQPHYHFHDQQYHFAPDHAQHATGVYRQPDMMHYEHAVDPGAALDPGMLNVPKVHSAMHTTGGVQGVEHGS